MRAILRALAFAAAMTGIGPAIADVPPPVPALPDTQRLTPYSITASTCNCSVGFALYGDSTDYWNWVKVYVNGAEVQYNDPAYGWTITSPTGQLGSIPRPITDATLTFNSAVTGQVKIVGARRPRRTVQFQEGRGVTARDTNQYLTDIIAQNRENWDYRSTVIHGAPGTTFGAIPSNCPNSFLGLDVTGQNFVCAAASLTGITNYIAAVQAATTGALPNSPTYADGTAGVGATLTAGSNAALTLDGVAVTNGNRVLIKDQATQLQNGIYTVTQAGSGSLPYILTRATDFDQAAEMLAASGVVVTGGAVNSGSGWVLTAAVSTVGTSPAVFAQFASPSVRSLGGTKGDIGVSGGLSLKSGILQLSGNLFNVQDYGAVANYSISGGGSMSAGSSTLTLAGAACSTADIGKYIAVQNAAASGANLFTTITSCSGSNYVLAASNASGGNVSSKIVEWGTDQSTAFNAAIAAAQAAGGGTVYVPGGYYLACQINMTNLISITLAGDGALTSKIFPCKIPSYGTNSGHWVDLTGSSFVTIRDMQFGAYYELAAPTTAFFMAQTPNGVSNRLFMKNIYVSGTFTVGAIYNYGVPSGAFEYADFYNYAPGAGAVSVGVFTASNRNGLISPFATVFTGFASTSNLKFTDVEFHKFAGAGADNFVVTLEGTTNLSFDSGVISGGASAYVGYYGTVTHISYPNNTFETESQPVIPLYGHFKNTGATVTDVTDIGASYVVTNGVFSVAPTTSNLVKNAF